MKEHPTHNDESRFGSMPPAAPAVGAALLALLFLYALTSAEVMVSIVLIGVLELAAAAMILLSAGGLAWPIVNRLAPPSMPKPFVAVSAVALGLWGLSMLMFALGSLGLMQAWLWWGIVLAGVLAAGFAGRGRLSRKTRIGSRVDGRTLVWVVCGAAIGLWLAGAMRPPGFTTLPTTGDAYDVLEYHLQTPREFYLAGHIGQLTHNVYSFYPLGMEMLSLMAFCLRGGAYGGMYLATILHGAFAGLAVVGVVVGLRDGEDTRGRLSGAMLATCPALLYLSWLAFAELAMVCYLALGLIWLRAWLRDARWTTAAGLGAMLGAACAVKYLSVGFVAGPVLAVMLLASLLRRDAERLAHVGIAALLTLALFSPWLIRNMALTGNPVFPLATDIFGQGYWNDQQAHRWRAGHMPGAHPPVPEVPGWQAPADPVGRGYRLWWSFALSELFSNFTKALAIISLCAILSVRGSLRKFGWEYALLAVLAIQLAVWTFFTRDMPWRFVAPAVVPLVLLAGWGLARLAEVKYNPLKKNAAEKGDPPGWGRMAAIAVLLAVLVMNFAQAVDLFGMSTWRGGPLAPLPGDAVAGEMNTPWGLTRVLPDGSRVALIGDAAAFYYPAGTVYATVFDPHPLAPPNATAEQLRKRAAELGVTHIFVNWYELWRLGGSYGIDPAFTEGLYDRWQRNLPPTLPLVEKLRAAPVPILIETEDGPQPLPGTVGNPDAPAPADTRWRPFAPPRAWPIVTLYAIAPADAPADWRPEPILLQAPEQPQPTSQPAEQ